jgi:hypothetical protein
MSHIVTLMRGLWVGDSLLSHWPELAVLGGIMLVSIALASFSFRWE